jgi:hypothetical protein
LNCNVDTSTGFYARQGLDLSGIDDLSGESHGAAKSDRSSRLGIAVGKRDGFPSDYGTAVSRNRGNRGGERIRNRTRSH